MSVRDNVWVATYRHRRDGQFNFWSRSRAYPDVDARTDEILAEIGVAAGYGETLARELSYGDQRLLEIAIALATAPRLLLFDEPMSGLSGEETRRVSELIRALGARYTVVMIEHKMNVVMTISDRITVMNFGKVIADGLPVEIAADAAVKRAYFGT
jgi:branched-chain amino acid transport system ATP-binding protein